MVLRRHGWRGHCFWTSLSDSKDSTSTISCLNAKYEAGLGCSQLTADFMLGPRVGTHTRRLLDENHHKVKADPADPN